MGWLQNTLREYAGDILGGERAPNRQQQRQHPRNGARPAQRPALDYLTAMQGRRWRPHRTPSGLWRLDPAIPDDYCIVSRKHPDHALRVLRTQIVDQHRPPWTIPLGMCGPSWFSSDPQHHVLAIAPPRSAAGKTSSLIIPATLAHPNPVVTASTKGDVLTATAMARAQYGKLWCYAPCGADDVPAGVNELRWSPLSGADEWDVAVTTATAMTGLLDTSGMRGGDHWKDRACDLLAAVFHWAAITHRPMREARDVVFDHVRELPRIAEDLERLSAADAARTLASVRDASREEARAIASTAARALKGYRTDAALRSTEDARFDIADFVNGGPYGVRADTLYITARSDEQELVAPLVVGLLDQIQRAIYKRHRRLEAAGLLEQPGAAPILFALDELYGLAPLPNLPHILSEGGSQGLLIAAAIQDLSLIATRWKDEANAFMTMFGHVLVYPGIRDLKTLEAISTLAGSYEHETRNPNVKEYVHPDFEGHRTPFTLGGGMPMVDKEESASFKTEKRPLLDPHQVMVGVKPNDHKTLIHFGPRGVGTVRATPYFDSAPWPMLLTRYLERALQGCVPEWQCWESRESGEPLVAGEDTLAQLPVPRLTDWRNTPGSHPCDIAWAGRYEAAVQHRRRVLNGAPRQARPEPSATLDARDRWVVTDRAAHVPSTLPVNDHRADSPTPGPATSEPEARPDPPSPPRDHEEPPRGDDGGSTPDPPPPPSPPSPAVAEEPADDAPEQQSGTTGPQGDEPEPAPPSDTGATDHEPPGPAALSDSDTGTPDAPRIYMTTRREPVEVSDEDLRLLASGTWTPTAEQLADVWGSYRPATTTMADLEAGNWQKAQAAAAKPEEDRTDEDKARIASAVLRHSAFETGTPPWVKNLADAERTRREAVADMASITRYDAAYQQALDATCVEGSPAWRDQKMRSAVLHRQPHSPAISWASIAPAARHLIVDFIFRHDVDAGEHRDAHEQARLLRIARHLEALEAEAERLSVPLPVARFDFEKPWGPEDDEAMRTRRDGDPHPQKFDEAIETLDAALEAERERRIGLGDSASVARYEHVFRTAKHEVETKPWVLDRNVWEQTAADEAAQDWGMWRWLLPDLVRLYQAFLLGDTFDGLGEEVHEHPPCGDAAADAADATSATDDAAPPESTDSHPIPEVTPSDPQPQAEPGSEEREDVPRPECWEPQWTADDDEAVRAWGGTGEEPECLRRTHAEMQAAIEREKDRRHVIGDARSIWIFEEKRAQLRDRKKNPRPSIAEVVQREVIGFWALFPAGFEELTMAFLRGDDLKLIVGWPEGISPSGSLRSRRDSLPSPGSSHPAED